MTNGTTDQYGQRRFFDHLSRCHLLLDDVERGTVDGTRLAALEFMDAIFPEIDPGLFTSATTSGRAPPDP